MMMEYKDEHGQYHRTDGPAVEYTDGGKEWYQNDKLHRIDGPACEYASGHKAWYQDGKRHRIDGPAIEFADGEKYWWVEGVYYTEQEFDAKTKETKTQESFELRINGYEERKSLVSILVENGYSCHLKEVPMPHGLTDCYVVVLKVSDE